MGSVNKVILIGNLGKDPEIKLIDGVTKIAKVSIATTERFKDKSGNIGVHTEWHNLVMWRNLADSAEKVMKKGLQLYVEGKIRSHNWIDKDGNKRMSTEIEVDNFVVLSRKLKEEDMQDISSMPSTDDNE